MSSNVVFASTCLVLLCGIGIGFAHISKHPRPPTSQPTTLFTTPPTPQTIQTKPITLLFGGDIMLGRTVESRMKQYGADWPLKNLGPTMASADVTVANLESPFRQDAPSTISGSFVLRGDPEGIASLHEAGIDLVSIANNHIPDMGLAGLQQTKKLLTDNSILFAGAGESEAAASEPVIVLRNGVRLGFLSYTYGVNFDSAGVFYNVADPVQAAKDVAALKTKVDMVIVLAHFGVEYQATENQSQITFAHSVIDAGASLVVGGHPHVDEPLEQYHDGVIFYSLGNLVFDQQPCEGRDYSALVSITLRDAKVKNVTLLPYRIYNLGQPALVTSTTEKQQVWNMFNVPSGTLAR